MTGDAWTTADYALIISLFSAALATASFVWNVWSKFIYPKPKVKSQIAYVLAIGPGTDDTPSAISLSATNYGPGEVTLKGAIAYVRSSFFGKPKRGLLRSYLDWPNSQNVGNYGEEAGLPVRLNVGDSVSIYFPESLLANDEIRNLGFTDGFGREHFADKASARKFRRARKVKR